MKHKEAFAWRPDLRQRCMTLQTRYTEN